MYIKMQNVHKTGPQDYFIGGILKWPKPVNKSEDLSVIIENDMQLNSRHLGIQALL